MAEQRFTGPRGPLESAELSADFDAAQVFEKLRVGKLAVYYRDGFKLRAFPYEQLEQAFIRVQEVRGRMCCGQANFAYFRLILVSGGKEYDNYLSENEKLMDAALSAIAQAAPGLKIGV